MEGITFDTLPNEILWIIFSFLSVDDLTHRLAQTNKHLHSLIVDANFWKLRCMDLGLDIFKHVNNLNWLMMSRNFGNLPSKLKIMIAGDFHCGKTTFVQNFLSDKKDAVVTGALAKVPFTPKCELWILDSEPISSCGYGENETTLIEVADVFVCLYAVNAIYSLMYILNEFLPEVYRKKGKNVPVILVGNKDDLGHEVREASQLEVQKIASDKLKCSYVETNSLTGKNVNEAFILAVSEYTKKMKGDDESQAFHESDFRDIGIYEEDTTMSSFWSFFTTYCSII